VVPIPNPGNKLGELDFLLGATEGVKDMIEAATKSFKPYEPVRRGKNFPKSRSMAGANSMDEKLASALLVQDVGQYNISVAPSLERLVADVQWDRFDIAADARDAILADMRAKFSSDFAFVVAQTKPGELPNDSGFGVVFESPVPFWPTCHEVHLAEDGHTAVPAPMDVTLVGINCIPDRDSCRRAIHWPTTTDSPGGWAGRRFRRQTRTACSLLRLLARRALAKARWQLPRLPSASRRRRYLGGWPTSREVNCRWQMRLRSRWLARRQCRTPVTIRVSSARASTALDGAMWQS
jgi:hypothetical protein